MRSFSASFAAVILVANFALSAAAQAGACSNYGNTNTFASCGGGFDTVYYAFRYNLPAGDLSSMSIYVPVAGNQLRLAVYSDASAAPNALLAQSALLNPVVGWNTFSMPATSLSAGFHWLAMQVSGSTIEFACSASGTAYYSTTQPFGAFQSVFPLDSPFPDWDLSFYATICPPPTPTFTSTRSGTPSLTVTPSYSSTTTPTFSATPTATPSYSATTTSSGTATATETSTSTATPTETPTRTDTPTVTPSLSDTATATATATGTHTPTATASSSDTPTATATSTSTVTPTASATFSNTSTATPSFTPTATPSHTGTATPTHTASATLSATPTVSPTLTISPSFTETPAYQRSSLGKSVLAPVPAKKGLPVCLYFDKAPRSSRWDIFGVDQRRLAVLDFGPDPRQCWDTQGFAAGVYFIQVKVENRDGSQEAWMQKALLVP